MSAKRRGLGRGLDALLGGDSKTANNDKEAMVNELPVDVLEPNRYQPRSYFDESGLEDLAESIKAQGVVQPIVVTPKGSGRYTIIAGERRWRAAQKAGLEQVPVVVREVADDQQLLEMALVENIQRADLNPIEEAEAYRSLAETFDLSQEDIAGRVGKGRTTITNALRLLKLPAEIQDYLREGRLTAGQARPLLALRDAAAQQAMADRAMQEGLTARDLESLAASPKDGSKKAAKKPAEPDIHTRAAVENLTRSLQTKVDIKRRKKGGILHIHFHSEDELIRLYELLTQGND